MDDKNTFYTFNTYLNNNLITASMEDYIEMIYRLSLDQGYTRVSELSHSLNVTAPSTNNMVKKLCALKLIEYEKYSTIKLTTYGKHYGEYLYKRHNTIFKFLSILGVKDSILEETEKIEHVINEETLNCIKNFIDNSINSH
ncbi:Iron (Metal) dependent repressor, DtxR family [Clostridium bornimense]|uniref:Manganese transport regulator n=1 Tax=Clostridium bornimense TaxID=1216932 RepID=W6RV34_9CLOT|nr:metal-dependent transcriptional regulator [Clostridium bornimense]CDM67464.1 Iron (Metal) dependent repressor, DtxR family [Clostridium bornimense]